jgi:hypothetical protein
MSLISTFISNNILNILENAFIAHEPEMQSALLSEVQTFSSQLVTWIESKISVAQPVQATKS